MKMQTIKCDRCGVENTNLDDAFDTYLQLCTVIDEFTGRTDAGNTESIGDYCPMCIAECKEFMKPWESRPQKYGGHLAPELPVAAPQSEYFDPS